MSNATTYAYTVLLLYPNEDPPQTYLSHVFSVDPAAAVKAARMNATNDNDGLIAPADFDVLLVITSFKDNIMPEEFRYEE